jgi:hypothetical protein
MRFITAPWKAALTLKSCPTLGVILVRHMSAHGHLFPLLKPMEEYQDLGRQLTNARKALRKRSLGNLRETIFTVFTTSR